MARSQPDPISLSLDEQLCFALYSTMHAVGKAYATVLPDMGLTYAQYIVMLVLWERDDLAVKQIGERVFLDSGTLTPLLKRLETAGLVRRMRDPADERQVRVSLTERGRALRGKAECVPDAIARAMDKPPREIARMRDDLLDLRSRLMGGADGAALPAIV